MADIKEGWVDRGETLQLSSRQGKKIHLPFSVLSAISELCLFSNQILWPLLLFLDSDVLEFTSYRACELTTGVRILTNWSSAACTH